MSDPDILEKYSRSRNLHIKSLDEITPIVLECYIEDCLGKVCFECKCSDDIFYICDNHTASHLKEQSIQPHRPEILKPDLANLERKKLVSYIAKYNSDLKILKQKIFSETSDHLSKIMRDMDELLQNINAIISDNDQIISDLINDNPKTFEDRAVLNQILESNFRGDFFTDSYEIEIPNECLDIIQAEVTDWNHSDADIIKPHIPKKLIRELLHVNNREESEEINIFLDRFMDKPLLHWCECKTNQVNYFNLSNYSEEIAIIDGLIVPEYSRSISIDHECILLCGGSQESLPATNENCSMVYKINIKAQSIQNLASMNTGRTDFCMTNLDGFYYALGGWDYQGSPIKKCERYSLENNRWQNIADLTKLWHYATCVSISKENCVYLIGGQDTIEFNQNIEIYDAKVNKWSTRKIVKPILGYYLGSSLLPNSNLILIFGGRNLGGESVDDCYLYNYKTNQVSETDPMLSDYNDATDIPIIFDNKIYSYLSKIETELREISIYDIKSGIWSVKS